MRTSDTRHSQLAALRSLPFTTTMVYQDTDDILLIVLTATLIAASYYLLMGNSKSKSCGGKAATPVKESPKVTKKVEEKNAAEVS